jgi:glycosyltransferase involved in cell wall biosynthesis
MTDRTHGVTLSVAFVGPLPPPLHGFSGACAAMLELLQKSGTVAVFDRSPRDEGRVRQLLRQLCQAIRYVHTVRRAPGISLYLGLSGGWGQLIDGFYVLIARAYRKQIVVHHHSFGYINRPTLIVKSLISAARNATHVVLSDGMASALADRYKIDSRAIKVISNAAFYGPPPVFARWQLDVKTPLRIGFLANITFAKGFVEFFEVLMELGRLAVPYRAYIAGPISPEARSTFDQLFSAAGQADYVGPLYDDAKTRFYQDLDILLFPTKYVNEAEPLVIHEALRSGVHVIACARGAIPELLSQGAGLVFDQGIYVASAVAAIRRLSSDRAELARAQQLSFEQAQRLQPRATAALMGVIGQLMHGP